MTEHILIFHSLKGRQNQAVVARQKVALRVQRGDALGRHTTPDALGQGFRRLQKAKQKTKCAIHSEYNMRKISGFLQTINRKMVTNAGMIKPDIENRALCVLYEVQKGNLRETPRNDGLILANRLGCKSIEPLTREVPIREIRA